MIASLLTLFSMQGYAMKDWYMLTAFIKPYAAPEQRSSTDYPPEPLGKNQGQKYGRTHTNGQASASFSISQKDRLP